MEVRWVSVRIWKVSHGAEGVTVRIWKVSHGADLESVTWGGGSKEGVTVRTVHGTKRARSGKQCGTTERIIDVPHGFFDINAPSAGSFPPRRFFISSSFNFIR